MKSKTNKICILLICSILNIFLLQIIVGQTKSENFKFVFMCDIHLHNTEIATQGFRKAMTSINRQCPDFVVAGGDLIFDALEQDSITALTHFELYKNEIKRITSTVYNAVGNHENFAWFRTDISENHRFYGTKMYENFLGKSFYSFEHKGWKFFVLNSTKQTENKQYIGYIDEEQMAWLKSELKTVAAKMPICIISHIPFFTIYNQLQYGSNAACAANEVVTNTNSVLELFETHNLKLILQAHSHIFEHIYTPDFHIVSGGSISGKHWHGSNGKTEEGFVLIQIEGNDVKTKYIDYQLNP